MNNLFRFCFYVVSNIIANIESFFALYKIVEYKKILEKFQY